MLPKAMSILIVIDFGTKNLSSFYMLFSTFMHMCTHAVKY
ncbi:hypothetical protein HMPREF3213_01730 [Heyndrickxia coagulans]|uniref:Uncharacterized protein n=1 Tax=Heyndrickxia coagulans TaxID=1398 RepID=A0A133KSU0_HEYCO|nr:hypothetical protein HMPREF3213_01730 [Heyndrickxia coagulans]